MTAQAVAQTVAEYRRLYIEHQRREWLALTQGTAENLRAAAESRAEMMRFWADPQAFQTYRAWDEDQVADEPLLARQVRLLHLGFAQGQRDPETIQEMTELMHRLEEVFTGFRARVRGREVTNNEIERILKEEKDEDLRRETWEASKEIGPLVAAAIRRLGHLRNHTAHKLGYANYHRMSLELDELDPDWLYTLLEDLAARSDQPYRELKAQLDAELQDQLGRRVEPLQAWHYHDPFFQRAPQTAGLDLDALFEDQDVEALAVRTYEGLELGVRDILERGDLYERELKDQHAFCMDVDRQGDVRILCNLKADHHWMSTLLHELGHAVYDKYIPAELPWLLRSPPHTLSTEALALLMGETPTSPEWLLRIRGLPAGEVEEIVPRAREHQRRSMLIFARWVMVMVNFERALFEDPDRDLDSLWWELVERYQAIPRPDGRSAPDWAAKYHVALAPAYYQNYLLGQILAVQWEEWLGREAGGLVDRPQAGRLLRERVFDLGASVRWDQAVEAAVGEPLRVDYYLQRQLMPTS